MSTSTTADVLPDERPAASHGGGRERALLEAVTTIGSDLDLQTVLRRITEAARTLVGARYGALGVIGECGNQLVLTQFITVAFDEAASPDPHDQPQGVLGVLLPDPRPLRLDDLSVHPETFGFPPGHPPMTSFLRVPIRLRDRVFGDLYLTEKRHGTFDADDEAAVQGLAVAAGVAIENARLYEQARRREKWMGAGVEVTTSLLSGADVEDVLALVARRARELVGSTTALIALPHAGELVVEVADGPGARQMLGCVLPLPGTRVGGVQLVGSRNVQGYGAPDDGSVLVVPLGPDTARGVLVLTRAATSHDGSSDLSELAGFALQATLALELAEGRRSAERVSVFADRDRIARDLHDLVIQRLFATGMQLDSVVRLVEHPDARARVHAAVDDLDATIREIRSTIFALHHSPAAVRPSLRAQVMEVVDAAAEQLHLTPSVTVAGLLDTAVGDKVGAHLLAVLRELLSNAARYAGARAVEVELDVGRSQVLLVVRDDGCGIPPTGSRSGLCNVQERAELLAGSFTSGPGRGGRGTELRWRVPVEALGPSGP